MNRMLLHPLLWVLGVAMLGIIAVGSILGISAMSNDIMATVAEGRSAEYMQIMYPSFNWPRVLAGAIWIALFTGGIMGCSLLLVSRMGSTSIDEDVDTTQMNKLSVDETLQLMKWIEMKQGQWTQLKRMWS